MDTWFAHSIFGQTAKSKEMIESLGCRRQQLPFFFFCENDKVVPQQNTPTGQALLPGGRQVTNLSWRHEVFYSTKYSRIFFEHVNGRTGFNLYAPFSQTLTPLSAAPLIFEMKYREKQGGLSNPRHCLRQICSHQPGSLKQRLTGAVFCLVFAHG